MTERHTAECEAAQAAFDMALTTYRVAMLACARVRAAILGGQAAYAREEAAYREALLASANAGVATLRAWDGYHEEHAQCKVRVY